MPPARPRRRTRWICDGRVPLKTQEGAGGRKAARPFGVHGPAPLPAAGPSAIRLRR